MINDYLNKGVPTPIAIGIILALTIMVGAIDYWQYSEIRDLKVAVTEMKIPEKKDETLNWSFYTNEKYKFEIKYPEDWQITTISDPDTKSHIKPLFAVAFEKPVKGFICRFEIEAVDSEKSSFQEEIDNLVSLGYIQNEAILSGYQVTRLILSGVESCASYIIRRDESDYLRIDHYIIEKSIDEENISIHLGNVPECMRVFNRMLPVFKLWN